MNEPLYDQVCAEDDEEDEVEDEYDNHLLYQTSKPGYYSEPYLGEDGGLLERREEFSLCLKL